MSILIIAAHPDDEVLGCGGTIASLSSKNDVYTLILGQGVVSRDIPSDQNKKDLEELKLSSIKANDILGVKEVYFEDLPDNKFDTVPLLDIVKAIEKHTQKINPEVIYTHHFGDLNIDHQLTHKAVITATRPIGDKFPKRILSFETLSSTEWNLQDTNNIFTPNVFVDISKTFDKKIESMKCYKSEIRDYPHPRSLKGIKVLAQKRGLEAGLNFAEAFCLLREIH